MHKFFVVVRYLALIIVLFCISASLVIVVAHDVKYTNRDYVIEVGNYEVEVHQQKECKVYFLETKEQITKNEATIIVFYLFEQEDTPIFLTISFEQEYMFVTTNDGQNAYFN